MTKRPPKSGRDKRRNGVDNERAQIVLDVAEELFALHGFDGVTMRAIAKRAQVDVALPNYYFGSKLGLLEAVFSRRAAIFNELRSDALEAVARRSSDKPPPLRDVIAAFLLPIAEAQIGSDEGWRNYCRLVAQVNSSPAWVSIITSNFDDLIRRFVELIAQALPGTSPKDLYWSYHFLSGSLSLSMANTGRLDKLSNGACRSDDFKQLYERMVDFYTAAFQAVHDVGAR